MWLLLTKWAKGVAGRASTTHAAESKRIMSEGQEKVKHENVVTFLRANEFVLVKINTNINLNYQKTMIREGGRG